MFYSKLDERLPAIWNDLKVQVAHRHDLWPSQQLSPQLQITCAQVRVHDAIGSSARSPDARTELAKAPPIARRMEWTLILSQPQASGTTASISLASAKQHRGHRDPSLRFGIWKTKATAHSNQTHPLCALIPRAQGPPALLQSAPGTGSNWRSCRRL